MVDLYMHASVTKCVQGLDIHIQTGSDDSWILIWTVQIIQF